MVGKRRHLLRSPRGRSHLIRGYPYAPNEIIIPPPHPSSPCISKIMVHFVSTLRKSINWAQVKRDEARVGANMAATCYNLGPPDSLPGNYGLTAATPGAARLPSPDERPMGSSTLLPPPYTSRYNSAETGYELKGLQRPNDPRDIRTNVDSEFHRNPFVNTQPSGDTPRIPQGPDPLCHNVRFNTVTAVQVPTVVRAGSLSLTCPDKGEFVTDAGLLRTKVIYPETSSSGNYLGVNIPHISLDTEGLWPELKTEIGE